MVVEVKTLNVHESSRGISILVYAASGVGKTSLAKTLPHDDTLYIDCEGGTAVLRDCPLASILIESSLDNCKEVFEYVRTQDFAKTNVFFDSASELEKFMLIRYAEARGVPSQHEYNACYFKMRDYLRALRDLREKGHNVVVTALEMPLEVQASDGISIVKTYPMMGRSIAPEVCGLFDVVAHLEIRGDEGHVGERVLRLDPTESVMAKDRYGVGRFFPADLGKLFGAIETARTPKKPAKRRRKRPSQAPQEANGAEPNS